MEARAGLSIIVASSGRPSLGGTLVSIGRQLLAGDELLVDVNDDAPWGHAARQRMMDRAQGEAILFMDDDDIYAPGALGVVRAAIAKLPGRVHIFRMAYPDGRVLWSSPTLFPGNVGTPMFCVPNCASLGVWGDRYEADFDFIAQTCENIGDPIWHPEVIARIRP